MAIREDIVKSDRRLRSITFNSDRKRMTTVVQSGKFVRAHTKGAGEIVLDLCSHTIAENGELVPIAALVSVSSMSMSMSIFFLLDFNSSSEI